jgi:hypothetical protein
MIRRSDNTAASQVCNVVGTGELARLAARVRPRGWALYFKGGWGSGTGWVDHQVALLRRGRRRVAVAILVTSSPSHAYGNETLRGVAARLLRGLRPDSEPR